MNEKDIFLSFLGKSLNLSPEQAAELLYQAEPDSKGEKVLKPTALEDLLVKHTEKIASLKIDEKTIRDEGHQRGLKEGISKIEKALKAKFSFESDLQGQELIEDLISTKVSEAAKSGEITDDKIKTHPIYRELEKSKTKEIDELKKTAQDEIAKVHSDYNLKKAVSTAKEKAKQIFLSLNPVLSDDETIRSNQVDDFVERFASELYQVEEDGSILIIDKEGKRKEDGHGNAVKFDEFVKSNAQRLFTFKQQEPTGGTGASGAGKEFSVTIPKSEKEYHQAFENAKTPAERAALTNAWQASQKQN